MDFAELMTDTVDLLKSDGTRKNDLRAAVEKNNITMHAEGIVIEMGDLIIRRMSNGAVDTYQVIDPHFNEEFHGIPAGYNLEVKKLGLPEAKSAVQNITYNFSGNNVRLNQNSTDNSTNIVQVDARVGQQIESLRKAIDSSSLPTAEKDDANEVINEIESAFSSGKLKRAVITAMLAGLPHVANVATIASTILSFLPGVAK